jgi:hypothetical protein
MKFSIQFIFIVSLIVSSCFSTEFVIAQQIGDNLGSHTATADLNLNQKAVYNVNGLAIGSFTLANSSSVALQIENNKTLLLPRIAALSAITAPINGMMVFLTSDAKFYIYQAGAWTTFASAVLPAGNIYMGNAAGVPEAVSVSGDMTLSSNGTSSITNSAIVNAKINNAAITSAKLTDGSMMTADFAANTVTTALLADQSVISAKLADGSVTNVKIAANALSASNFSGTTAGPNRALLTDDLGNHSWVNLSQILVPALSSGRMIVADANGTPAAVTMSGDVTVSNTGVTAISANAVTGADILDGTINTADLANSSVTAPKISSTTAGNNKVMTTNNDGGAEWADQALVQGFVVGDIKPYFPSVSGTTLPANWVMCNGQTLSVTGSALNGKVLPNLNNNTFLIGSKGASGVSVGANTSMISQANLPGLIPVVTSVGATEIIPSGSVAVATDGLHTHSILDYGHSHLLPYDGDENGAKAGKVKSTDRVPANPSTVPILAAKTGIVVLNAGVHNHAAAFSGGNTLGAHSHPGMISSSINGGVTQTAISNIPSSITVWWIMKVK